MGIVINLWTLRGEAAHRAHVRCPIGGGGFKKMEANQNENDNGQPDRRRACAGQGY
jgi:hypothetical protein